jgi:Acyl-CoA carboxylase epsilon subunit
VAESPVPYLRVVRGDASPEEIAALVAALTAVAAARAAAAAAAAERRPARPQWNAPARLLSAPARPGAGAWRRSALP